MSFDLGDWINSGEVLLSLVGFALTYRQAKQAKEASERAEDAAKKATASLVLAETIAECVVALAMMEEIKKHHRTSRWDLLLDLLPQVKRRITVIRTRNPNLSNDQTLQLVGAMGHFTVLEQIAERMVNNPQDTRKQDPTKLNAIVSEQYDHLHRILTEMQRNNVGP